LYPLEVPVLKHAQELGKLPNCPPPTAAERQATAYRFVRIPVDADCFVPVALTPARRVNRKNTRLSCSSLGLSMFGTEEQARAKFGALFERIPEIRKSIGTHLAQVYLMPFHGLQTYPAETGHFDLFEYHDVNLVPCTQVVGLL
jgi:hypothetical protein